MVGVGIDTGIKRHQFFICAFFKRRSISQTIGNRSQRPQQNSHGNCSFSIEFDGQIIAFARFEFHPRTAIRNQFGVRHLASGGAILIGGKINTRRTDQLADNHTLGSIDDESPVFRHDREVTEENILNDSFSTHLFAYERHTHVQRRGKIHIAFQADRLGILGVIKPVFQTILAAFRCITGEKEF